MGESQHPTHRALAWEIASSLTDAAERLNGARDTRAFLAAIDAHDRVWLRLRQAIDDFRQHVPKRFLNHAPHTSVHGERLLDDDDIETLIHMDRTVAAAITRDVLN